MGLKAFLEENSVRQVELARTLRVGRGAVCSKLAGRRRWYDEEIRKVLRFLGKRLRRPVSYEEAFLGGKAA